MMPPFGHTSASFGCEHPDIVTAWELNHSYLTGLQPALFSVILWGMLLAVLERYAEG